MLKIYYFNIKTLDFLGANADLSEMYGSSLGSKYSTFFLNIFFKCKTVHKIVTIKPASSLHSTTENPDVPMKSDSEQATVRMFLWTKPTI